MANRADEVSVKMKNSSYRVVKAVAALKGESLCDYLSSIAEESAKKDLAKITGGVTLPVNSTAEKGKKRRD